MSDRTLALGSFDSTCERPSVAPPSTHHDGSRPGAASIVRSRIPGWRFVAALDVTLATSALVVVLIATSADRMPHGLDEFLAMRVTLKNVIVLVFFMASTLALFSLVGLYDPLRLRSGAEEMRRVFASVTLVTGVADVFPLTSTNTAFGTSSLFRFWLVAAGSLVVARTLRLHLAGWRGDRRRVLIVGTGRQALRIHRELCSDRRKQYELLGFIDTAPVQSSAFVRRRTLGSLETLEQILVGDHVDEVYVGLPVRSHYPQIQETLRVCERVGVKATYHADIFDAAIARPRVHAVGLPPFVEMQVAPEGSRLAVKRLVDIVGALTALVLFSPIMLAAMLAIKMTSPGPAFYAQERYGLNRRRFRMFKLRTMIVGAERLQADLEAQNEADGPVFKIAVDPRLTPIGHVLRRTSIDELPQLWNVLRGDMSLVGPRPLPLRDVARITRPSDMRRFSVRPGLTCLWQISGRSGIGFDEWVRLDLQYIDRWSLRLDFKVLVGTVPAVLRGTGAA